MVGVRAANPQVDVMQFRLSMFSRCDRLTQLAVCGVHSDWRQVRVGWRSFCRGLVVTYVPEDPTSLRGASAH